MVVSGDGGTGPGSLDSFAATPWSVTWHLCSSCLKPSARLAQAPRRSLCSFWSPSTGTSPGRAHYCDSPGFSLLLPDIGCVKPQTQRGCTLPEAREPLILPVLNPYSSQSDVAG